MKEWVKLIVVVLGGFLVMLAVYFGSLVSTGGKEVKELTNIYGITYPASGEGVLITEEMAHTDLYLNQPGLFKTLELTVDFEHITTSEVAVGIRDNSFWLSYEPVAINSGETVRIPLTDKLQDKDQSYDVMFFASPRQSPDEGGPVNPTWKLNSIDARVINSVPKRPRDWFGVADYLFSIVRRERVL